MILKMLPSAVLLLIQLALVNCQWYGGYDSGYGQQYVIINPYGYDDPYSQYSYPYDPQHYSGYSQPCSPYSAQPIVIVVNNERDIDCGIDDFLSLILPVEDKCCKEPVYVPYPVPVVVESHDRCECRKCESRCDACDSCNKCRCKDDCQCKKKEKNNKRCKCNECQKHSCNCGALYHKM